MSLPRDIPIGTKVGALTVIEFIGSKNKDRIWQCRCDCGADVQKSFYNLNRAFRKCMNIGCGCTAREAARRTGRASKKHGFTGTKLERLRRCMINRCTRPSHETYKYYGGRGISVCEEWLRNPGSFYAWAINNGYQNGLSIERLDNEGNYEPSNCSFVTKAEQASNKRNNRKITYSGKTMHLAAWSRELGINHATIAARLDQGWPVERALTEPVR